MPSRYESPPPEKADSKSAEVRDRNAEGELRLRAEKLKRSLERAVAAEGYNLAETPLIVDTAIDAIPYALREAEAIAGGFSHLPEQSEGLPLIMISYAVFCLKKKKQLLQHRL